MEEERYEAYYDGERDDVEQRELRAREREQAILVIPTLVDDERKREDWYILEKDSALSNLDGQQIELALLDMEEMMFLEKIRAPRRAWSFDQGIEWTKKRLYTMFRLNRSKEGFERKMMAMQIQAQMLMEREEKRGLLDRILRRPM